MINARTTIGAVAVAAVVATAMVVGDHAGGSDPAPPAAAAPSARIVTDAEFCTAFQALADAQEAQLTAASPDTVAGLKAAASAVADLTPGTALPDQARAGVDYVVTAFLSLPDDATAQDVVESDDSASVADDAHAAALAAYLSSTCQAGGLSQAS